MTSSATEYELGPKELKELHIIEWEHLNLWRFYPLALASSWSVRCLLYPMSVVKSRLQLQKQNNVYSGMRHCFTDIIQKEGFTALYRGFWVTLPQLSASFVYSSIYEKLRNVLTRRAHISSPPVVSALAGTFEPYCYPATNRIASNEGALTHCRILGGAASTCTQLIFVPTDIVAQYMMIHNKPESFTGGSSNVAVINALKNDRLEGRLTLGLRVIRGVYKVDGLRGFYRGFLSSVMLYIPSSMVFWSTYYNALGALKSLRRRLSPPPTDEGDQPRQKLLLLQAASGAIGGISSAICTNPLEVLRIRIQGLAPRMINNGIYSCLLMIGYETVKRASVLPEFQDAIVW
ncbi:Protein F13G3.7 a [Aphelenchoides avenae]|nr:Protein F13G3.7 a [Aphelenchus avenae]